jgi:hypothetical protein
MSLFLPLFQEFELLFGARVWIRMGTKVKSLLRICIRSKVISRIQNRILNHINLQMTSQNVWIMSLIDHFFKGLSLYLEARIWIRIQNLIKVKSLVRICIWIRIK